MTIENHVVVNISKDTSAPSQVGFGVPLILSLEANLLSSFSAIQSKSYDIATALTELISDGFTSSSQTFLAMSAYVSQSPRPEKVKVAKRAVNVVQVDTNTIDTAVNDNTYTTTINGIPFTFLSDGDATLLEIQAGLVAAINAGDEPVTAAPSGGDAYTLTADNAGQGFSNSVDADQSIVLTTPNTGPASELIKAQNIDDDFYFVGMDVYTELDIIILAAYIETQLKVFDYQTDDADSKDVQEGAEVPGSESLMKFLKDKNYDRTYGVWVPTSDISEHKHASWTGLQAPKNPGSTNWAYKTVNGASADEFTPSEKTNIEDKNGNTYTIVSGIAIFFEGRMASGEFIDITRGIDFIVARIKENVFGLFTSEEKVPYDDGGLESIGVKIQEILDLAERRLILVAGSSSVTVPTRAESSTADRVNRLARDFKFTAELAGAVNKAIIDGTLTI